MRTLAIDAVTALYALALATATVMLTFIALNEGFSLGVIASLSAASAATQFISRSLVNRLFRIADDRSIMAGALLVLALSMVALLVIPGLAGLLVAQLLQGISRAGFWSGSQVHVLRLGPRPQRRMARNQFLSNGLAVLGPILAGLMATGEPRLAGGVIAAIAIAGAAGCLLLTKLPLFERVAKTADNRLWRYQGMRVGAFGTLAAGSFNAVLTTFVPILFGDAGWTEARTGLLIGAANAGLLVGSLAAGAVTPPHFSGVVATATLSTSAGIASLVCLPMIEGISVIGIVVAGIGSGIILTLGPTLVSSTVPDAVRGSAVVFAGVFRAGALFITPLAASAAGLFMSMPAAMLLIGVLAGSPGAAAAITGRSKR